MDGISSLIKEASEGSLSPFFHKTTQCNNSLGTRKLGLTTPQTYWLLHLWLFMSKTVRNRGSLVAQMVKCLPAMWENWVWSLGQEDPLEKELATHSNTLAWKIPWMEEPGRLQSRGSQRVRHDWVTSLVRNRCLLFTDHPQGWDGILLWHFIMVAQTDWAQRDSGPTFSHTPHPDAPLFLLASPKIHMCNQLFSSLHC